MIDRLKITGATYQQASEELRAAVAGGARFVVAGPESGECGHRHRSAIAAGDCQRRADLPDRLIYCLSPEGERSLLTYEQYCIASGRW